MLRLFKEKYINFIIIFCSASAVFVSIFADIILKKHPCQLCLVTRWSYIVIILLSILSSKFKLSIMRILLFFVFFSMVFGFYHLGVENHWWTGPSSCISALPTLDNIEQSVHSNVSYCDKVNFEIFGISSTFWNVLLMSFLFWLLSIYVVLASYIRKNEE